MNIKELRESYKLSQQQLSDLTNIPRGRIAMWESRNSTPKHADYQTLTNFFESLKSQLSHDETNVSIPFNKKEVPLNKKYNEGEIIARTTITEDTESEYQKAGRFIDLGNGYFQMFVPFVEQFAYAGYLVGYSDTNFVDELPKIPIIVRKMHKGNYMSIQVRGDSMDDNTKQSICQGDIAVGRKVEKHHWKSKLHFNQWDSFIIVHQDGIVIKSITDHDVENGIITLTSLNPDKDYYPTYKMKLSEVYELYNVVQVIRNSN